MIPTIFQKEHKVGSPTTLPFLTSCLLSVLTGAEKKGFIETEKSSLGFKSDI